MNEQLKRNQQMLGAFIMIVVMILSCMLGSLIGYSASEHTHYLDKEIALYQGMWSTCAIERLAGNCDDYVKKFQDKEFFVIK